MLLKSDIRNALHKHFDSLYEASCEHHNGVPLNSFTRFPANWVIDFMDEISNAEFISDEQVKEILSELYEEEFSGSLTSWCWGEARYILFKVWQEKKFYRIEFF